LSNGLRFLLDGNLLFILAGIASVCAETEEKEN